ncbi:40S ribosomal protein S6-B [Apiospora arundinis]
MDKKTDDILRRPLYVYDLPPEVLSTLEFKESPAEAPEALSSDPTPSPDPTNSSPSDNLVGAQSCSLCALAFTSVEDQRSHQKSDLHHYNLKQKLRGNKPVTEVEFESLIGNLDESLSGSDSDESDEDDDKQESTLTALLKKQATLASRGTNSGGVNQEEEEGSVRKKPRGSGNAPMIWFSSPVLPPNNYFGMHRAILTPEQARNESEMVEVLKKKQLAPIPAPKPNPDANSLPAAYKGTSCLHVYDRRWSFCRYGGFTCPKADKACFDREATILAHKTFHRYTTRRKQGGSQSANDNAKGNAHSAGSSIRRYNEQALIDEVRQLLQEWKGLIDTSDLLFIRATGATNRRTLFGPYDGQVMRANDPRIRGFPFSTRRATQNELMRCFIELTRLKVREFDPNQIDKPQDDNQTKAAPSKPAKPVAPKLSEEEETALLHTNQLQAFIRRSKLPALLSYLKNNDIQADFVFQPTDSQQNHHAPTPLHFSASQNSTPLVSGLLLKAGANPTLTNQEGKTAFELAGDRATRDAFRVARDELGEQKWDWEAAKVPPAMKRAEADKREERERKDAENKESERKKAEEARLKLEGPKVTERASKTKGILGVGMQKTAQEKREDEARGVDTRTKDETRPRETRESCRGENQADAGRQLMMKTHVDQVFRT